MTTEENIKTQVRELFEHTRTTFLSPACEWVYDEPTSMTAYLRIGKQLITHREGLTPTLEIANISFLPSFQRKGHFTNFVNILKYQIYEHQVQNVPDADKMVLYLENVSDPDWTDKLLKYGWEIVEYHPQIWSMYLPREKK